MLRNRNTILYFKEEEGEPKLSLPSAEVVRGCIQNVANEQIRYCLMATYLFAGRITEAIGRACPSDNTVARGPKGSDVTMETYKLGQLEEPACVFTVKTAKRRGIIRKIGLPLNYEPWAEPLYNYFQKRQSDFVFPFTRQFVGRYVREHATFKGLTYQIEHYSIYENGIRIKKVEDHDRPFALHALRHQRASELVEFFGFGGFNLAAYGGWTITTAQAMFGVRTPRVFSRYLYLNWQGYFPKLLKKRG